MTRRYRGENSNVDDIASRFDKHLEGDTIIREPSRSANRKRIRTAKSELIP